MSFTSPLLKEIIVQVAVDTPVNKLFDYIWSQDHLDCEPSRGQIVSVEFGKKEIVGVIIQQVEKSDFDINKIKQVTGIAPLPVLSEDLMSMAEFASAYYQKSIGEVLVPAIPKYWRQKEKWELLSKEKRANKKIKINKAEIGEYQKEIKLNDEHI